MNGRAIYLSAKLTPGTKPFLDAYHSAIASLDGSGTTIKDFSYKLKPRPDEAKALEFVRSVWGAIEVTTLAPSKIKQGLAAIKKRYDSEGFAGADRANRIRTVLSKVCQIAIDEGFIDRNPVREVKAFNPDYSPRPQKKATGVA